MPSAASESQEHEHYQWFMRWLVVIVQRQVSMAGPASLWRSNGDITFLAAHPFQHLNSESGLFQNIERLTVVLYDKTSPLNSVNEAREELFCRKSRSMDRIPPTQDALLQHSKRAVYQAGSMDNEHSKYNKSFHLHRILLGPRLHQQSHGYLFGWPFPKYLEHAASWSNVPARETN